PNCWSQATGLLAAPTVFDPLNALWNRSNFGNSSVSPVSNGSARINIYTTNRKSWLISPSIDLGTTPKQLEFDLSLTQYYSNSTATLGADDKFAVIISTDNGVTWTSANTLQMWQAANPISN